MIKTEIYLDGEIIKGFRLSGHAGFDRAGRDIVCAAVSMLVINTVNAIDKFTQDKTLIHEDEKNGVIEFEIEEPSERSSLLLDTMLLGLEDVKRSYGKKFIEIKKSQIHKEV